MAASLIVGVFSLLTSILCCFGGYYLYQAYNLIDLSITDACACQSLGLSLLDDFKELNVTNKDDSINYSNALISYLDESGYPLDINTSLIEYYLLLEELDFKINRSEEQSKNLKKLRIMFEMLKNETIKESGESIEYFDQLSKDNLATQYQLIGYIMQQRYKPDLWENLLTDYKSKIQDNELFRYIKQTNEIINKTKTRVEGLFVELKPHLKDNINKLINELKYPIKRIDESVKKIDGLDKKVLQVNTKTNQFEKMIDGLDKKVLQINNKINQFEKIIDDLNKNNLKMYNQYGTLTKTIPNMDKLLTNIKSTISEKINEHQNNTEQNILGMLNRHENTISDQHRILTKKMHNTSNKNSEFEESLTIIKNYIKSVFDNFTKTIKDETESNRVFEHKITERIQNIDTAATTQLQKLYKLITEQRTNTQIICKDHTSSAVHTGININNQNQNSISIN